MKKNGIIILLICAGLAGCAGGKKGVQPTSPYQRAPIVEVTEEELSNDSSLIDATMQQLLGNQEESLERYRALLRKSPKYAAAHFGIGKLFFSMGWLDSALYHTKTACQLDNSNHWYKIQLASIYEHTRDEKNLTATWETLVSQYPDETDYYYSLSNAYLLAGDVPKSIEALDRVEKRFGVTEAVSLQKQKLWNAIEKPEKARKELEKLAEAIPTEPRYSAILAESYMQEKNYAKALQYYTQIYENNPENEAAPISLASCYLAMGDMHNAYRYLRRGGLLTGGECRYKMVYISEFLRNQKFFESYSRKCFLLADTVASRCTENDGYTMVYGQMLAAQERYEEAVTQFKAYIKTDKSQYAAWEALLISEERANMDQGMLLEDARQTSELFPLHLRPYLILARGYLDRGDCKQANFYIERCLMIAPKEDAVKQLNQQIKQRCQ